MESRSFWFMESGFWMQFTGEAAAKVRLRTKFCHCWKRDQEAEGESEGKGDEEVGRTVWRDRICNNIKRITHVARM